MRRRQIAISPIIFTPYAGPTALDGGAILRFLDEQIARAGILVSDIATGALIMTGVAAARENAERIAHLTSSHAGRMVAAAAGHLMEARLAAIGSGAVARSARSVTPVMSIDVGGGTTKISLCRSGRIVSTAVLRIGARLIRRDMDSRAVMAMDPTLAGLLGPDALRAAGRTVGDTEWNTWGWMLGDLVAAEALGETGTEARANLVLARRDADADADRSDAQIVFSGGVSEYVYGRETRDFGDLGRPLAQRLKDRIEASGREIVPNAEGIRATVIGASVSSAQLSGETIYAEVSGGDDLRNMLILRPSIGTVGDRLEVDAVTSAVERSLEADDQGPSSVALAIDWAGPVDYQTLDTLAAGIARAWNSSPSRHGRPIVIVLDRDLAGALGVHLRHVVDVPNRVVVLDGIGRVNEHDYLDVGEVVAGTGALVVVVKSLIFEPT